MEKETEREQKGMQRTGHLIGHPVLDRQGALLGRLEEVIIGLPEGEPCYAILSFGEIRGMGGKYFPLPWHLLDLDQESRRFILKIGMERLKTAPGFDPRDWPCLDAPEWCRVLREFYEGESHYHRGPGNRRGQAAGRRRSDRERIS